VAPEIIKKYHGLSKTEAADLAVSLSTEIAEKIAPYTDGWYLITPFGRVGLMKEIIANIRG
jgi:homocysteine S-methyltransferase